MVPWVSEAGRVGVLVLKKFRFAKLHRFSRLALAPTDTRGGGDGTGEGEGRIGERGGMGEGTGQDRTSG